MEFEKLSKAELVVKAQEMAKLIEDQKHLAAAVEAKDKQIIELIKASSILEKDALDGRAAKNATLQLNATVDVKNQEINKLRGEIEALKKTQKDELELIKKNTPDLKTIEVLSNNVKLLEERNKALIEFVNPYVINVRSLLKGLQGTLELGVETEAILSEKINKK